MHTIIPVSANIPKSESYQQVFNQLAELIKGEPDFLANAANTAALLYLLLPDVNWVGFYLFRENELVLGPFQGRPACTRIGIGKGVCGKAAADRETLIVSDVAKFKRHIVCDPASRAEIAVPLLNWGKLIGVLDVDSAKQDRFDDDDREGLEALMSLLLAAQTTDDDVPDFEGLADRAED
jgi:GAF domain-containing protein